MPLCRNFTGSVLYPLMVQDYCSLRITQWKGWHNVRLSDMFHTTAIKSNSPLLTRQSCTANPMQENILPSPPQIAELYSNNSSDGPSLPLLPQPYLDTNTVQISLPINIVALLPRMTALEFAKQLLQLWYYWRCAGEGQLCPFIFPSPEIHYILGGTLLHLLNARCH